MRKSLVLLGKLATRLASALFLALPLVPGCNGCNPEPDGDVIGDVAPDVVQVVCQQDGLYLDGVLVVPSDPMADPSPECESSSIRFEDATRFHACCGEVCCDFDGDRPIGKKEGSPCTSTDECQSGLTCVPSGDQWTCRYGREGDPCDVDHQCGTGLYCNPFGACRKPVDEEGAGCQVSDEQCAWPMSCVCRVSECACYDGTSGDPCESDTCGEGLYCLAPQGGKDAICFEGVAGDPCKYDWQCDAGLGCTGIAGGESACAVWLGSGQVCAESLDDPLVDCGPGLVCLSALDVPVCGKPGQDEAPCNTDDECDVSFHCLAGSGKCYDGKEGDPCQEQADCALPWHCSQMGDGPMRCYKLLGSGSACETEGPWVVCGEGLACLHGTNPPTCGAAASKWEVCLADGECAEGMFCLPSAALCVEGGEGEPCGGDDWCKAGLYCAGGPPTCLAGDFGDPCNDGSCAEGFACYSALDRCYDGGPGTPCQAESDCQPDTHCITTWTGSHCTALQVEGGPCGTLGKPFSMCGYGLVCADPPGACSSGEEGQACENDFHCSQTLACHPVLLQCFRGDLGDPCAEDFPCTEGYVCRPDTQTCAYAEEGAPCSAPTDCASEMLCVASASACYLGDNGDPCAKPGECGAGFDCLMAFGKCYDGQLGSPCISDAWCGAGLACLDIGELRCAMPAAEGDACGPVWVTFVVCPEGTTCNAGMEPPECAAPGGEGAPCWEDEDCLEGFACTALEQVCAPEEGGQP